MLALVQLVQLNELYRILTSLRCEGHIGSVVRDISQQLERIASSSEAITQPGIHGGLLGAHIPSIPDFKSGTDSPRVPYSMPRLRIVFPIM